MCTGGAQVVGPMVSKGRFPGLAIDDTAITNDMDAVRDRPFSLLAKKREELKTKLSGRRIV